MTIENDEFKCYKLVNFQRGLILFKGAKIITNFNSKTGISI